MKMILSNKIGLTKESEEKELYAQRIKNLEITNSQLESRFDYLNTKYLILEKKLYSLLSSKRLNITGDDKDK